jgi:hypothetical protein
VGANYGTLELYQIFVVMYGEDVLSLQQTRKYFRDIVKYHMKLCTKQKLPSINMKSFVTFVEQRVRADT